VRTEGLSRRVKLIGPRGFMTVEWSLDNSRLKCCACSWFMDATFMGDEQAYNITVMHDCPSWWKGYARYTIRPNRPTGRRTA
jgi:hypothetical protein